jgi:intein/homing endonuclease
MKKEVSKKLTDPKEIELAEMLLKPLNSKEELRDWMYVYFDIWFPMGHVHPSSNSSPIEAAWYIYDLFKTNKTEDVPRVVLVSARDCFKCQAKGSKLLTPKGFLNIEDAKIGDTVWSGWNWRKITNWIDDGVKDGIKIKTDRGYEFTGSPIHRYWALRNGQEQWIESKDLNPDTDLICLNTNVPTNNNVNQDNYELGYFLGILIGDGSLSFLDYKERTGRTSFFALTTIDEYIKDFFFDFCERKLQSTPRKGTDGITYRVATKKAVSFLKEMGVKSSLSYQKTIPPIVWTDKNIALGFINGVFDTDGTFSNSKKNLVFSMSAETLLREMQTLLLSLGIFSTFRKAKKLVKFKNEKIKQNHLTCHLTINGHDIQKFLKIGFINRSKKAGKPFVPLIHDAHDSIPYSHLGFLKEAMGLPKKHVKGRKYKSKINLYRAKDFTSVSVGKLKDYVLWAKESLEIGVYEGESKEKIQKCIGKLESILKNRWLPFKKEDVSKVHFYDLTVEQDHSYWSNGSISHNTLTVAAIEVLLFLHFQIPEAHAAAIKFQAGAAVNYCNNFFRKVRKYMEHLGWQKTSDNKTLIEWKTDQEDEISLTVLTASREGFNSRHTPYMALDELDLMDAAAYEESKMVPSMYKGRHPLVVILSTRKFASGLMEKTIKETPNMGGVVLKWNIIDVTERIPLKKAEVDKPKVLRYVSKALPMINLSPKDWEVLSDKEKDKYEPFEAYAGIAEHPMLPVMRNYLVDRPQEDHGFLYKPLSAVYNNFRATTPEFAEAQLLCNRPSSAGLVYRKFDINENTLTTEQAFERLLGKVPPNTSYEHLIETLQQLGIEFYGGADWGHTDETSFIVSALLPNGDWWILDHFSAPAMEIPEIIETAENFQKRYGIKKWYVDQNYPAYCVELRKKGLKVPEFNKDVNAGISAVQKKITNSTGKRSMFIVRRDETSRVLDAFNEYSWKRDGKGDIIEGKPDHKHDGTADIMDSIRYIAQNLFTAKTGGVRVAMAGEAKVVKPASTNAQIMRSKIEELAENDTPEVKKMKKRITLWT